MQQRWKQAALIYMYIYFPLFYFFNIITTEKLSGLFGWLGERDYSSLPIPPTLYHACWHLIKEDLKTERRIHISGEKNYVRERNKKRLKGEGNKTPLTLGWEQIAALRFLLPRSFWGLVLALISAGAKWKWHKWKKQICMGSSSGPNSSSFPIIHGIQFTPPPKKKWFLSVELFEPLQSAK